MKYESNTPMSLKDIARKPFFLRTGRTRTDVLTRVMLYASPMENGGGIKSAVIYTRTPFH